MNGTTVNAANPAPNQSLFFKACVASYILKASPITGASYKSNTLLTQPAPGLYPYVGLYGSPLGSKLVIGLSLVFCGGSSSIIPPFAYLMYLLLKYLLGLKYFKPSKYFNNRYIKYANGGIIDEDPPQNTSERPITNFDPKGDPYNPTYGYNPGAGYVRSVFDLYDAPVIGDALSIYDATQALKNKDWLGAGLAALTVVPFIPTVSNYKKSLNQQLNRITGITPDISKLQKQSDWNDLRNRSIERLYDPEVRARAAKIKSDYNVDLQSTYDKIINQYENDYFSLPEAEIMQLQDAKAMIDLQEEAARRYKQYGIKPTQKDFRIKIDNAVTPSQEITNHEINHFNQYIHQDNPSWNKSELDKITKQFKGKLRDKNPIDPENTSYFMNWMEQNAYGINMLDRLKELNIKPTKQNILKYLKSLPDTDSIKKAALQFKNLDDYIKWLNTMPLADNGNINEIENYNFA